MEISGDVTDAGRTNEQGKIELLSQMDAGWLSFAICMWEKFISSICIDIDLEKIVCIECVELMYHSFDFAPLSALSVSRTLHHSYPICFAFLTNEHSHTSLTFVIEMYFGQAHLKIRDSLTCFISLIY